MAEIEECSGAARRGFSELWDYTSHQVQCRQWRAARSARRTGVVGIEEVRSFHPRLPPNLCQYEVRKERWMGQRGSACFFEAQKVGFAVYQLTVIHPEWFVDEGALRAEDFKRVRDWLSRRARALRCLGQQRVLGAIDVAWEDRRRLGGEARWSLHVHALVCVEAEGVARSEIRKAFNAPPLPAGSGCSVQLKRLKTDLDLLRSREYATRALLLHHEQHRSHYLNKQGEPSCWKRQLPAARDSELAEVLLEIGPQRLWVLSGLRRKGGELVLHDSVGSARR